MDGSSVVAQIRAAFAGAEYPGDEALVAPSAEGSGGSEEPALLAKEFKGKNDWRALSPRFIDQAPEGNGSALSHFSRAAFRFYLPAYLIADVEGALSQCCPIISLYAGLEDDTVKEKVERGGTRTWLDEKRDQFAGFTTEEAAAIVSYLRFKQEADATSRRSIEQALKNFWLARVGGVA